MTRTPRPTIRHFFQDDTGSITIWQWPNPPLGCWILFTLISRLTVDKHIADHFQSIGTLFLLLWAVLETTKGLSPFRRLLGLLVLVYVITQQFLRN